MILIGGRAILAGRMTLGEFITYILFTGLMAAPVVQIASIGTQISEAFAGLDRIRELMQMATEDQEDATREPLGVIDGEVAFEDVSFEYNARRAGPEARQLPRAAPGRRRRSSGRAAPGKSTLISLVMAFNRPKDGRVLVDGRDLASIRLRDYRVAARRRAAGQLPVRRHDRRQHPLRPAGRDARGDPARQPHRARRRVHRGVREEVRHGGRRARA